MSKIGKLPIPIPSNVKAEVSDNRVRIEGPKGKLDKTFDKAVSIQLEQQQITVKPAHTSRFAKALQGTARSIINNMVTGVREGYSKNLEIDGVGFRANLKGKVLDLALGFSHPILYSIPENITITVDNNTKIKVEGIDKAVVGQVAASIKAYYPVEPYKGKGIRIDGEFVRRKEGKKTA